MAHEVRLWKIDAKGTLRDLQHGRLDLESRLEEWLARDITTLDRNLLVIGTQVSTDHGGVIDLLCIDRTGDLVIVELKRDKTPREITAQALDYASWVQGLPAERILGIAASKLGGQTLEDAFQARFSEPLPEAINESHSILIVGARIDDATERIIKYLSDTHGVRINAATFEYFKDQEGEFLARVFLTQPEQVETRSRVAGTSKRRPRLSFEELAELANRSGVGDLYNHAFAALSKVTFPFAGATSLTFYADVDDTRRAVINLLPLDSSATDGLCFQVYDVRIAALLKVPSESVKAALPPHSEPWCYWKAGGPEWTGFRGHFKRNNDIDRLVHLFPPPSA